MLGGALFFSATAVLIKIAGQTLHTFEIVFFRCLFGMLVVIPLLMQSGWGALKVRKPALHLIRAACAVIGMSGGFYALTHLELATAISLSFTRPLFMILLAAVFLREFVRWRRGLATAVGFIGVLIMVQPGANSIEPAVFSGLLAALTVGGALITVKLIAPYDAPVTIMLTFSIATVVLAFIPATFVWQTPTRDELLLLMALGIVASCGQYCFIRAFAIGEATVMSPIDYVQIILGSAAGFLLFNERPGIETFIGASVIVISTLYIVVRGARIKAPPPAPPDPAVPPPAR
ncbi:MAG: EamA family transporter [Alphaproteobacteria bacterium]|nr:EamA family transporter [Alphaproteobacteria bacterium]